MSKLIVCAGVVVVTCLVLVGCDESGGANRGAPKVTPRDISNEPIMEDPTKMAPGIVGEKK